MPAPRQVRELAQVAELAGARAVERAAELSRFAIVDAGRHSVADPRATFAPQRAGD